MRRAAILLACAALAACGRDSGEGETQTAEAPAGAACPSVSPEAFAARGVDLGSGSTINGVSVRRLRGSSSCKAGDTGEPACDLNDPGTVQVAAGGSDAYFDVPQGRNATITVSGGQARCVLN